MLYGTRIKQKWIIIQKSNRTLMVHNSSPNKKWTLIFQSFEKSVRYEQITKALINQGFCGGESLVIGH